LTSPDVENVFVKMVGSCEKEAPELKLYTFFLFIKFFYFSLVVATFKIEYVLEKQESKGCFYISTSSAKISNLTRANIKI
jgi:hypothetical protein